MICRNFPSHGKLFQRQLVRSVAVDLVGGSEDKRGIRAELTRGFEENERSSCINGEIGLRIASGPVVGGLSGSMDNEGDLAAKFLEQGIYGIGIADVEVPVFVTGNGFEEQPAI